MKNVLLYIALIIIASLSLPLYGQDGTVNLKSFPSGAKVIIDGKIVGITPYSLNKVSGNYSVTLEKDGYNSLTIPVVVYENRIIELDPVQLVPKDVEITVNLYGSADGKIYIDENRLITQGEPITISPGKHTFTIKVPGKNDLIEEVVLPLGKDTSLAFYPPSTSHTGKLTIKTNVQECQLIIKDNSFINMEDKLIYGTSATLEIPEGSYYITIQKQGYNTFSKYVKIDWDKEETVNVSLKKKETVSIQQIKGAENGAAEHFLEFGGYYLDQDLYQDSIRYLTAGASITYTYIPRHFGSYSTIGLGLGDFLILGGVVYRITSPESKGADFQIFAGGGYDSALKEGVFNIGTRLGWYKRGKDLDVCPYSISISYLKTESHQGIIMGFSWRIAAWTVGIALGIGLAFGG